MPSWVCNKATSVKSEPIVYIYNQTKGWLSAVIIWLSAWIQPRRPVVSKFSRTQPWPTLWSRQGWKEQSRGGTGTPAKTRRGGSCKSNSKPRDFEDLGLFQHFTFLGQKRSSFPKHSPTNIPKPAPANYSPTVLGVDEEAWRKMITEFTEYVTLSYLCISAVI